MQLIHTEKNFYTVNVEKGEEVFSSLAHFLKEQHIHAAHISGLGAASHLVIAYYNTETLSYERKTIEEDVEILSLNGNVGVKEKEELVIHLHGTFGRRDFSVFGGHLFEILISVAGEIQIVAFSGKIQRAYDKQTDLTLMCPLNKA